MKTIKYLTVFCMMICMIMQLNIYHWGNSYKIVIDCYDEEKEIAVSEKEFHVIKIGDKILCNVYRSANRVVTVELNEHWKDAGDKYDN